MLALTYLRIACRILLKDFAFCDFIAFFTALSDENERTEGSGVILRTFVRLLDEVLETYEESDVETRKTGFGNNSLLFREKFFEFTPFLRNQRWVIISNDSEATDATISREQIRKRTRSESA